MPTKAISLLAFWLIGLAVSAMFIVPALIVDSYLWPTALRPDPKVLQMLFAMGGGALVGILTVSTMIAAQRRRSQID